MSATILSEKSIKIGKARRLLSLGALLGALIVCLWTFSGCVLSMPKPLLSARHVEGTPNLVGRYLDEEGSQIRVLGRDNTSDNSFVAYPPSKKSPLNITIQHLTGQKFVIQAQPEDNLGVLLTVAEIDLPKVTLYIFPQSGDAVKALAKKNQVTLNKDGLITEYKSAEGVIKMFMGLFDLEKEALTFVKQPK